MVSIGIQKWHHKSEWNDLSAYYLRRWVVQDGDADIKAFVNEKDAQGWMAQTKFK